MAATNRFPLNISMAAFPNTRWRKQDAAWLALAVSAHALLLLIPLGQEGPAVVTAHAVTVELTHWSGAPATDRPQIPEVAADPTNNVRAPKPIPFTPRETPGTTADHRVSDPVSTKDTVTDRLTTARLLHLARHSTLEAQPSRTLRELGAIPARAQPPGWNRPGNLFDGMIAPPETEIVDRWLAADGSHNVVVNLPNGETVCGRAEAWNPMQPLVEHVMMFRNCGGGKRTFEMASREMPDRRNPE